MIASQEQSDVIDDPQTKAVALREEQLPAVADAPPAHDLRHAMMSLPVEQQTQLFAEYIERRQNIRALIKAQLVEGVHFGFPPGCEPKTKQVNGQTVYVVWSRGKEHTFTPDQWTPKPELYAAGADFLCDLLGLRDSYESDLVGWQQMGSKPGVAVQKCRLFSRATDELIGEGMGAYSNASDPNNAIKMAAKCAKVGAIIHAYGLRDLFTQDAPKHRAPENENPPQTGGQSQQQPRGRRQQEQTAISEAELKHLKAHWAIANPDPDGNKVQQSYEFKMWVIRTCERTFNPLRVADWTRREWELCCNTQGCGTEAAGA